MHSTLRPLRDENSKLHAVFWLYYTLIKETLTWSSILLEWSLHSLHLVNSYRNLTRDLLQGTSPSHTIHEMSHLHDFRALCACLYMVTQIIIRISWLWICVAYCNMTYMKTRLHLIYWSAVPSMESGWKERKVYGNWKMKCLIVYRGI